jgi:hypothetical protein
MDAIVKAHEGDVQMIDSSVVRVHQQGATAIRARKLQAIIDVWGRSRGKRPTRAVRGLRSSRA